MKPYLFDATVAPNNMRIELTATDHGAALRVTFPATSDLGSKRVCFTNARWEGRGDIAGGTGKQASGVSSTVHQDRLSVSNFAMHIYIESPDAIEVSNEMDMTCFKYKGNAEAINIRMATSLISQDQAVVNYQREVPPTKAFDEILLDTKMVWKEMLGRVDVIDPGPMTESNTRHLTVFYTGLWRALTFPRRLDETSADGRMLHYSPYDPKGKVHPGPLFTDNGFWDTFRTVYPLLSLLYPDHLGFIVQGWLNAYTEGGWLPSWASPGYRNCMVGTFADVVVADAIVKGVGGFDLNQAKNALLKDAYEEPPKFSGGAVGKEGLNDYINIGFVPHDDRGGGESVSRTLDYGFADYASAQALFVLSSLESFDAEVKSMLKTKGENLIKRAGRAYESMFDKGLGLMQPKSRDGRARGVNPIQWGSGYTEGNAWHHSFPPYALTTITTISPLDSSFVGLATLSDVGTSEDYKRAKAALAGSKSRMLNLQSKSLQELHGGDKGLLLKLHQLLATPSNFQFGSYGQEIHEMTEARALAMGQYSHNNQPCHHLLYLFALVGDKRQTQISVRAVMDRAYGMDFYAGDEDNGEQGSWFVLSALGLYSATPGARELILGSPLFRHVRINRQRGGVIYDPYYTTSYSSASKESRIPVNTNFLDIIAMGNDAHTVEWDRVSLNRTIRIDSPVVDFSFLQTSGILRFHMKGEPVDPSAFTQYMKLSNKDPAAPSQPTLPPISSAIPLVEEESDTEKQGKTNTFTSMITATKQHLIRAKPQDPPVMEVIDLSSHQDRIIPPYFFYIIVFICGIVIGLVSGRGEKKGMNIFQKSDVYSV